MIKRLYEEKRMRVDHSCKVLRVSRSGYCKWRDEMPAKTQLEQQYCGEITKAWEDSGRTYGSPRIYQELRSKGISISEKKVAQLMKKQGISGAGRKSYSYRTTDSVHSHEVAARHFKTETDPVPTLSANEVWVGDITYIRLQRGFCFLAVYMDVALRKIVGYSVRDTLQAEGVIEALKMAIGKEHPVAGLIVHTDRGVQYACESYRALIEQYGYKMSMSRKGNCYDNAFIESFFRSLKVELIHRHVFKTIQEARAAIFHYIEVWYNRQRRHSSLGYMSPVDYERFITKPTHFCAHYLGEDHTPAWCAAQTQLAQASTRAEDSIALIDTVYQEHIPKLYPCHGVFKPSRVHKAIKIRVDDNQKHLAQMLDKLRSQLQQQKKIPLKTSSPFTLKFYEQALTPDEYGFVLNLDGEDIEIPEDLLELFEQLSRDLGKIPEQLLTESKPENVTATTTDAPSDATTGNIADLILPEWDHAIQRYRKDWCHIYIEPTDEGEADFIKQTLSKHYGIIHRLHRTFEALRNDDSLLRKQTHGDEIDLDAVVESLVDTVAIKSELNDRIFIKTNKEERDVAVVFLIDMSASTRGWVNRLEKEALLLLCESLQILGDRYAIYGFNGHTRKQCKIYPIKAIDEDYNATVQEKISALKAEFYTRIGAAIRYVGEHLQRYDAKTKILIVLSDGKPDDADGYRDSYGIEDTRKALFELRKHGIHSHCITIDKTGQEYLPYMYGHTRYSIINDIEKLPYRMAEIYRQITC